MAGAIVFDLQIPGAARLGALLVSVTLAVAVAFGTISPTSSDISVEEPDIEQIVKAIYQR